MRSRINSKFWTRKQTWVIAGLFSAVIWLLTWTPPNTPDMTLQEGKKPCWRLASDISEPSSAQYQFHPEGVSLDDPVWADYHWEGNITEEEFEDAIYRDNRSYIRFKILDNRMYMHETSYVAQTNFTKLKADTFIAGVLIALAMFRVPDVDILADFAQVQQHVGVPSLVIAFQRAEGKSSGFSMPGPMSIRKALGPVQQEELHECLMKRYPLGRARIPKAVWRGKWERIGSTEVPRAKLVRAAAAVPHIADVKFNEYRYVSWLSDF